MGDLTFGGEKQSDLESLKLVACPLNLSSWGHPSPEEPTYSMVLAFHSPARFLLLHFTWKVILDQKLLGTEAVISPFSLKWLACS